ncbi:short-chain dehydrogenase/reductase SDR [Rhodococcus ruber BKS 20-38]|uniref:Short-chain dehydrogenase/reductase SDR n=1 Tax=Rhodococcus ruber BKS 20-38 TaxID=1278076 RepID=M2X8F6_9NOCA|nr:SDR family oxidoreductase [Rhodococcus ruber]EME57386.1 short-chain dehydrogenase/reductase SDR [Rhodococcus ruber BKS 20-38]
MRTLLAGKSVVITGGGSGLGRAYAEACAAHGARVTVNDVDVDAVYETCDAIAVSGGVATPHVGSIASWEVAQELIALASREDRLDGVVANAAINHHAPPWGDTEETIRRTMEVNILGVQFVGVHAMRAMLDTGGSIVTVTSGARFGIPRMSTYGASKGAVSAMTASWAIDGRPYGIRVNSVSPLAHTRMSAADDRPDRPALAAPDRIAPLIVVLLSDESDRVTGQTFRFDGDELSVYEEPQPRVLSPNVGDGRPCLDEDAVLRCLHLLVG